VNCVQSLGLWSQHARIMAVNIGVSREKKEE